MQSYNIFNNHPDTLLEAKADFLLLTCSGEPKREAEFLCQDPSLAPTSPSLALIIRAVANLTPMSALTFLELETENPFDAKRNFIKGMEYGSTYELRGNYLLLTHNIQNSLKKARATIDLLTQENLQQSRFEALGKTAEPFFLFCAGFILEASRRFHIVLGGGFEMAAVLCIADALREEVLQRPKHKNITLATNSNDAADKSLAKILTTLSYTPHALYTPFDWSALEIPALSSANKGLTGMANIDVALAYAASHQLTETKLLNEIEVLYYTLY